MLSDEDCREILLQFPPVEFAFAYGSGAVTQGGYSYKSSSATGGKDLPMLVCIEELYRVTDEGWF